MEKQGKLSRSEAAAALGVTPKTLYMWERTGKIPAPERDWRNWRWYSPEQVAVIRAELLGPKVVAEPELPLALELSTRNRLMGTVKQVSSDKGLAEVTLILDGGQEMAALIPAASARRMGLQPGSRVLAFVRETDVILGT